MVGYQQMKKKAEVLLLLVEVAEICRVPVGTVRHWIRLGRLPSMKPGRRRMVRSEDLQLFLEQASSTNERSV